MSSPMACRLPLCPLSMGKRPKFMVPMFIEAISGLNTVAGCMRSCTAMEGEPPVVRLMMAGLRCLIDYRKGLNASGR